MSSDTDNKEFNVRQFIADLLAENPKITRAAARKRLYDYVQARLHEGDEGPMHALFADVVGDIYDKERKRHLQ